MHIWQQVGLWIGICSSAIGAYRIVAKYSLTDVSGWDSFSTFLAAATHIFILISIWSVLP